MDFETIYTAYFQDVYRYIQRLSGDDELAEEITSQCFFKAIQNIDHFRGECELRVWLCQIAKNCYYAEYKRKNHLKSTDDLSEHTREYSENAEEIILEKSEADRIRIYLHTISEPYKEVFMWRVFAELSFQEIGALFGKSQNWACVTYHRAKHMIQERMEESK